MSQKILEVALRSVWAKIRKFVMWSFDGGREEEGKGGEE